METTASRVRAVLERHVAAGAAPGAVALVGRGWEAEVVVVGNRAKESPGPMRRDGIFRIASMTKPILAAAALQLVEEGRLRLDEPVDRFLPELADRRVLKQIGSELHETVPARRPITLEDLLTFRCGLGIVLAPPGTHPIQQRISELGLVGFGPPDPASPLGPDEWLAKLGTLPLMAQPGEQWMYNTGSYVLGVLLARASRVSLPQLLH